MAQAWLALGANLGDPTAQVNEALARLDALPEVTLTARSPLLVTKAWGKTEQPDFVNMAAGIETTLSPEALMAVCLGIEAAMGRLRLERWGPRVIDIDIIAYERLVRDEAFLTLPHPYAHERDFVLEPLRLIAPQVAHWLVERRR